jgi:DNA polymerase-3 subunit gamma/tau
LSIESVLDVLGVVEKTQVVQLISYLSSSNVSSGLLAVDDILKQGKDLTQFLSGLIEAYRDLLIIKMVKTNHDALINASKEYIQSLIELAEQVSPGQITRSLELLIELSKSLKYSQNKRIVFETTLVKLTSPEVEKNYNALLERVERLEMALAGGKLETDYSKRDAVVKTETHSVEPVESEDPIEDFIEFTDMEITLDEITSKWPVLLNTVSGEKKGLHPILMDSAPVELKGNRCLVGVAPENKMFVTMLTNSANSDYLNGLISRLVKKSISLEFTVGSREESNEINADKSEEAQILDYFKDYKDVLEIK